MTVDGRRPCLSCGLADLALQAGTGQSQILWLSRQRPVAIDDGGVFRIAYPTAIESLVADMLSTAEPLLPDAPVLLGELTPDADEAMAAIHDGALADAPELRSLGRLYRGGR